MTSPNLLLSRLNEHCGRALEAAASLCQTRAHSEITLEHYLLKLFELGEGDLTVILRHYEIDADPIWNGLLASLERMPHDLRGRPGLSRSLISTLEAAWMTASLAGETQIRSVHLLQALQDAPHLLRTQEAWPLLTLSAVQLTKLLPKLNQYSSEAPAENQQPEPELSAANVLPDTKPEALQRFTIDLTAKARAGQIDPVFGRGTEIRQMIDILARRRKNNPILVGDPGVGKTALVEGLALKVAEGDVPPSLKNVHVLVLDLGLLQAGAGVKGEFEQRLKNVIEAVQASAEPVLLFIDEAHTLIGAGNAAGAGDAANLLKPALARGELRTIAATTWSEYKQYFERDAALERRFQLVKVDEPDDERACLMLRGLKARYATHHGVHIRDEAISAAVHLSRRYLTGRQLPDKAVDLLDTAAARVKMSLETEPLAIAGRKAEQQGLQHELLALQLDTQLGLPGLAQRQEQIKQRSSQLEAELIGLQAQREAEQALISRLHQQHARLASQPAGDQAAQAETEDLHNALATLQGDAPLLFPDVDAQIVARVIADWTGVPVGSLLKNELTQLLELEQQLTERVIGQDTALQSLSKSLLAAKTGLKAENAPLGVYLLVGPSGVGKTETALALSDLLFGGERSLITINLSEYQEAHTVSQLKGSPPGYVGYGQGGVLTEAVRQRPYSVILLDEVEKAHRDVLNMFYQVFDRGFMRDGEGREIDFRNTVILMTSNLGSDVIMEKTEADPAISSGELQSSLYDILRDHFQPALLARFQTIVYRPLQAEALTRIVRIKLDKAAARLQRQYEITLEYGENLISALVAACLLPDSGARNIDSLLNQQILPVISRMLLERLAVKNQTQKIILDFDSVGEIQLEFI
ncbi:MAG: type VI secretion system ATPase TssH [Iodobacter sp.]